LHVRFPSLDYVILVEVTYTAKPCFSLFNIVCPLVRIVNSPSKP